MKEKDEIPEELHLNYNKARPNRFVEKYIESQSVSGKDLLQFAGSIPPEDLEIIRKAIEEDCENIDFEEWDFENKLTLQFMGKIEDIGLAKAMEEVDEDDLVSEKEVFKILKGEENA